MSQSVHAHQVLHLLAEQDLSLPHLLERIQQSFGENATFHTCSREGMKIEALLEFFVQRQKVFVEGEMISLNAARVCSH
ncbi:YecH family protein [Vibrio sp. S9_S30]|uniref:YecH family metal-binding protein n=1 Tax=Vibrio sp. S9_S30 TaxID=2720226 RepID=UPI001680EBB6|nr:YecH family metal-binding protein [Vibrio sp. S9_S30]MBD1559360.1 YecH family protein [Vibrio sp. S9_S30]